MPVCEHTQCALSVPLLRAEKEICMARRVGQTIARGDRSCKISAGFNLAVSCVMILVPFSRRSRSFGVMRSSVGKTRGGGPTLVPNARGAQVAAEIFVMADDVTVEEAMNML